MVVGNPLLPKHGWPVGLPGLPWHGFHSKPLEKSHSPLSTLKKHGDLLNGIPAKRIAPKAQGVQTIGGANGQRGWQDDDDDDDDDDDAGGDDDVDVDVDVDVDDDDDDDDDDDGIHVVVNHHHRGVGFHASPSGADSFTCCYEQKATGGGRTFFHLKGSILKTRTSGGET